MCFFLGTFGKKHCLQLTYHIYIKSLFATCLYLVVLYMKVKIVIGHF